MFSEEFSALCENLSDVANLNQLSKERNWEKNIAFEKEILDHNHVVVVTDPQLTIVHATKNIKTMNGYAAEEIIGAKPKIFQGAETCPKTSAAIGEAIKRQEPFETVILNYRKDGSMYKCWIKGQPIRNKKGKLVNFIAFEREVA